MPIKKSKSKENAAVKFLKRTGIKHGDKVNAKVDGWECSEGILESIWYDEKYPFSVRGIWTKGGDIQRQMYCKDISKCVDTTRKEPLQQPKILNFGSSTFKRVNDNIPFYWLTQTHIPPQELGVEDHLSYNPDRSTWECKIGQDIDCGLTPEQAYENTMTIKILRLKADHKTLLDNLYLER